MPTSGLRAMPDLTCRARLCSSLALRTGSIASWHSKTCVSLTLTYNSCSSSCASAPLLGLRRPFMGIRFSYSNVSDLTSDRIEKPKTAIQKVLQMAQHPNELQRELHAQNGLFGIKERLLMMLSGACFRTSRF